jgi:restriction system protein
MLPVLRLVSSGLSRPLELVNAIGDAMALPEADRVETTAGGTKTKMDDRTRWAMTHLHAAGLTERVGHGRYVLSKRGAAVLGNPPDVITIEFLSQWPEYRSFRGESEAGSQNLPTTSTPHPADGKLEPAEGPLERMERAEAELQAALVADLLERVRAIAPDAFEALIVDLLIRMGFGGSRPEAGQRIGKSGDGGVDGVIRQDALGLDAVYVQAKRYAADNTVGAPAVQGFAGALLERGATKGVFVTTSSFSSQARQTVRAYGSLKIVLIDGKELARLMIAHEVGVRTVQTFRIHRVDLDGYADDDA